jgi:hypothetical protein
MNKTVGNRPPHSAAEAVCSACFTLTRVSSLMVEDPTEVVEENQDHIACLGT